MAPLPAPAEKPSHRVSDSQSHAKLRPPAQVAVFCAALWPKLQPALTTNARALANAEDSILVLSRLLGIARLSKDARAYLLECARWREEKAAMDTHSDY